MSLVKANVPAFEGKSRRIVSQSSVSGITKSHWPIEDPR
jgi:hypothetical protein